MTQSPAEVVFGPTLIGMLLNVMLWGVCLVQMHLYERSSCRDSPRVRTFIYLLFLVETLQTLFTVIFIYDALVINFGNFPSLENANWKGDMDPVLTGIIAGSVQIFFVRRLKILTRNWIVVTIVSICGLTSILMGIATSAAVHFVPKYAEFRKFKVVVIIWLVSAVIADIFITTSMVIYLNKWRKTVSNAAQANSYIDHIVRMTIQTGLLTSTWAIMDLTLFLANPNGLHLIFNFSLSKLYSNSLMSSLNARDFWKFETSSEGDIEYVSDIRFPTRNTIQANTLTLTTSNQTTGTLTRTDETKMHDSADFSQTALGKDAYEKGAKSNGDSCSKI